MYVCVWYSVRRCCICAGYVSQGCWKFLTKFEDNQATRYYEHYYVIVTVHIIHWNGKLHDENNLRTLVRLSIVIWDYLLQDESQYRMAKRNGTHTLPLGAINHSFTCHIWGGIWKRKTRHDLRSRFVNVMGGWFDLIIGFPPYPNGTGIYSGTESVITSDKNLPIGDWQADQSSQSASWFGKSYTVSIGWLLI